MKWLLIGIAILGLLLSGCIKPEAGLCLNKNDLSDNEKSLFEATSNRFIDYFNGNQAKHIYDESSKVFKQVSTLEQIQESISHTKEQYGAFKSKEVYEILKINSNANNVICDKSYDSGWQFVAPPSDKSSFILVIAQVETNTSSIYFLNILVEEDSEWKLRAYYVQPREIGGRSANDYLRIAESQLEKGNKRNALFFYSIGGGLLLNNPIIKTDSVDTVNGIINKIEVSGIPRGTAETWTTRNGQSFSVYKVRPNIYQKGVALQVHYVTQDLDNKNQLEVESFELAKYVDETYPEYREIFDGIILSAVEKIPGANEAVPSYNNVYEFSNLE